MSLAATAQRAINSDRFHRWLERRRHLVFGCVGEAEAERWLLQECQIQQIADLDENDQAARRFRELCDEFKSAMAGLEHAV